MSDKKENILKAALELFANEGYNATSTSKIAKLAGVSEGLIFRHFENKKGLLDALYAEMLRRYEMMLGPVIFQQDAKEVLRMFIRIPFTVSPAEYDFWRLQFKLKWQADYHHPDKVKPAMDKLVSAFTELGYDNPQYEADLFNMIVEGISVAIVRDGLRDPKGFQAFLFKKYQL